MRSHESGELLLAETAASGGTTSERVQALLEVLRQVVPFDAAFLAFADPLGHGYHSLVSVDLDGRAVDFLSGPQVARDIEVTGTDRQRPPLGPSDLPYPAEELPTWAECLIPSGIQEGLGVALFAPGGRHVGHLAVLSGSRQPPSPATRRRLGRLTPILAQGIDPMRSLVAAARLVRGATAGVVLHADGGCQDLPGLQADTLLVPRSPVLAAARERIGDGNVFSSFLWPLGGSHAPDGHVRVTVLAAPEDAPPGLPAVALLSPRGRACARRGAADRGRPPGAHPRQARGTDQDTRRGPRITGRPLRPRGPAVAGPRRVRALTSGPTVPLGRGQHRSDARGPGAYGQNYRFPPLRVACRRRVTEARDTR
jgi:hypothetical protein